MSNDNPNSIHLERNLSFSSSSNDVSDYSDIQDYNISDGNIFFSDQDDLKDVHSKQIHADIIQNSPIQDFDESENSIFHISDRTSPTQNSVEPIMNSPDNDNENNNVYSPRCNVPLPPYPHREGTTQSSNFLNRYRGDLRRNLFNTITYVVERHHFWSGGIKRKRFILKKRDSNDILASAEFAGAMSSLLNVSNSLGTLCQIETNPNGPYVLRIGNSPFLVIALSPYKEVTVHFENIENYDSLEEEESNRRASTPDLINNGNARRDPTTTFGGRECIQSIKNVKLCSVDGKEFIAVRKVAKNVVEVDALIKVHFLACFAVAMFMYMYRRK